MKPSVIIGISLGVFAIGLAASASARPSASGKKKIGTLDLDRLDDEPIEPIEVGKVCLMEDGEMGALSSTGECVVFWNEDAATALEQHLVNASSDSPDLCATMQEYNPVTGELVWIDSPAGVAAVHGALQAAYPGRSWPPTIADQGWVKAVYQLAWSIFRDKICNLPVVS